MTTKHRSGRVGVTSVVVSFARTHARQSVWAVGTGGLLVAFVAALAAWPLATAAGAVSAFVVFAVVSAVRGARAALGTGPDTSRRATRRSRAAALAGRSPAARVRRGGGLQ